MLRYFFLKGVHVSNNLKSISIFTFFALFREEMLAEIGVVMREDGNAVGVFSPKKVTIHTKFTNFDTIDLMH